MGSRPGYPPPITDHCGEAASSNYNSDYDYEAYREVQQNLQRLIELGQLRPMMQPSLALMAAGCCQVEASDEGLMTNHIESCLRPVLKALRKRDLPAADLHAWCTAMVKSDRVAFICDQELPTLRRRCAKSPSR